jgi:F0F1-type ATP synthase assembly protein I
VADLERNEHGPEPGADAEYERLLHKRKGVSGSQFAGIGIQFALSIVLFAFAGVWLDKRLGTSPIFVLLLVLGGAGVGFWSMVRKLK